MRYYQRLALKRSVISGIASIALLVFAYSATLGKDLQGYLESAQSYSEKGNLKAADSWGDRGKPEVMLRQAVSIEPKASGAKLALARQLLGINTDEAAKLADEVLADEARSSEAVVIKGEALAKLGNADAALQQF